MWKRRPHLRLTSTEEVQSGAPGANWSVRVLADCSEKD